MGLTKAQLEALNDSSFPNNNAGYITPAILRDYNDAVITNTVNQDSYLTDSQSFDSRIDSLEAFSASLDATFATDAQLNASSSTLQSNINTKLNTSSFNDFSTSVNSFNTAATASIVALQQFSSSLDATFATDAQLAAVSSALNLSKVSNSQTSSMAVSSSTYALTASFALNTLTVTTSSYADRAGQADTVYVGSDVGDALRYVAFTEGANYQQVRVDTLGGLRYNPATNTLSGNVISASSAISTSVINGLGNASAFSASVDSRINAITSSGGTNTGSLLVTASAAGNTITFTKGDASTFDVTVAGGTVDTSSFITTGELTGTQYISGALEFTGSARIKIATASFVNSGTGQAQVSIQYDPSASAFTYKEVNQNLPQYLNQAVKVGMIATGSLVGGLVKVFANPSETGSSVDGSTTNEGGLLFASQSTTDWRYVFGLNGNPESDGGKAFVVQRGLHKLAGNATSIPTASLSLYPIGSPIYWDGNAQGACTLTRPTNGRVLRLGYIAAIENGANPYVREIWYDPIWEEGETTYLPNLSGSVFISNQSTQFLPHITASAGSSANIIFNTNSNTATTLVSGSANLFVNPNAPTTGFTRLIGSGSGNIALNPANVPQISSSMAFPINMNSNYFGSNGASFISRGPISSSAWTISGNSILGTAQIGPGATLQAEKIVNGFTMTGNQIAGTLAVIATQAALSGTLPVSLTNNNVNGGATLNLSSSAVSLANNSINDSNFSLTNRFYSSSIGLGRVGINTNTIGGASNQFIVSGSQLAGVQGLGAAFNQNILLGNSNTIFINASESRISGSNVYHNSIATGLIGQGLIVTGSSNASDAASFGSLFAGRHNAVDGIRDKTSDIVFAVGTGTSTTNKKTGFLIDSGSNTFVEGTLRVSGSLTITGSTGDLFMYGHKMFNSAEFWSTTTQSGSAGVSGSITFNNSGSVNGVSLANNSQLTVTNAGTYNIQFSAQIETSAGADTAYIWFKKNGSNITDSATKVLLANNTAQVMTVNILDEAAANDYYELAYQFTNGNATILTEAASGNIPAVPSVIATITQVR